MLVLAFCLPMQGLVASGGDVTAVFQLCVSPFPPLHPTEDFQGHRSQRVPGVDFFSGNRDREIQHPCLQATGDISGGGGGGVEVLGMQLVEGLG